MWPRSWPPRILPAPRSSASCAKSSIPRISTSSRPRRRSANCGAVLAALRVRLEKLPEVAGVEVAADAADDAAGQVLGSVGPGVAGALHLQEHDLATAT